MGNLLTLGISFKGPLLLRSLYGTSGCATKQFTLPDNTPRLIPRTRVEPRSHSSVQGSSSDSFESVMRIGWRWLRIPSPASIYRTITPMSNNEYTTIGVWSETANQLDQLKRQKYNTTAVPTVRVMHDLITQELEDDNAE